MKVQITHTMLSCMSRESVRAVEQRIKTIPLNEVPVPCTGITAMKFKTTITTMKVNKIVSSKADLN